MVLSNKGYAYKWDMSHQSLRSIPTDIPDFTTDLLLNNNQISTIADDAFNGLGEVEILHLTGNRLREIRKGMWQGLKAVKRLYLSSNLISYLGDEAFSTVPKLEGLWITSNNIRRLAPEMFKGMNSIKRLDFGNNKIETVEPKTFYSVPKSMQTLNLDYNNICTLPSDMLNRRNHPKRLMMRVRNNPVQCDTNVCWLMKAEADGWLWGSEMSQVVKDCNYVTNHRRYCLNGSTSYSAKWPMFLILCETFLVLVIVYV